MTLSAQLLASQELLREAVKKKTVKKLGLHAKCIVPNNNVNNKVLLQFFLLQQYFYRKDFNPFCKTENSSETFANALDAFIIAASAIPSPTNKRSTL